MKRFVVPVAAGVVVMGAVSAFAASLTVNSSGLGSGNATVSSCNSSASVTYNTVLGSNGDYQVTTAPITTATGCAGKSYKVTLVDASNAALAEATGTLDSSGSDTPDFSASAIDAAGVAGVAVVISG